MADSKDSFVHNIKKSRDEIMENGTTVEIIENEGKIEEELLKFEGTITTNDTAVESVLLLRQTHDSKSQTLGEDHEETQEARISLAESLHTNGELDEAETLFAKLYETRKKQLCEEEDESSLKNQIALADILGQKKSYGEAAEIYIEIFPIMKQKLDKNDKLILETMDRIIQLANDMEDSICDVRKSDAVRREVYEPLIALHKKQFELVKSIEEMEAPKFRESKSSALVRSIRFVRQISEPTFVTLPTQAVETARDVNTKICRCTNSVYVVHTDSKCKETEVEDTKDGDIKGADGKGEDEKCEDTKIENTKTECSERKNTKNEDNKLEIEKLEKEKLDLEDEIKRAELAIKPTIDKENENAQKRTELYQAHRILTQTTGYDNPSVDQLRDEIIADIFEPNDTWTLELVIDQYEKIFQLRLRGLGEEHEDTIETISGLGRLFLLKGRLEVGLLMCQALCRFYKQLYGNNDKETVRRMNIVAEIVMDQGYHTEAIVVFKNPCSQFNANCSYKNLVRFFIQN